MPQILIKAKLNQQVFLFSMSPSQYISIGRAHALFASDARLVACDLLLRDGCSIDESRQMERAAQTFLYHAESLDNIAQQLEAFVLLSHIYDALHEPTSALYYAHQALYLAKQHSLSFEDKATACEALFRAFECAGNPNEAHAYQALSRDLREVFLPNAI